MRRVVGLRQMLEVEVRVDLRRGDARVAQHLLHRAQVAARLQHVRREGVAQHVRMHVRGKAQLERPVLEPRLHRARAQTPAALRRRTAPFPRRARARRAARSQASIAASAWLPTGTMRVLLPLPVTRTVASRRLTSSQVEPGQLRQAQPGRIEKLEYRLVAHGERRGLADLHAGARPRPATGRAAGSSPDLGARMPSAGLTRVAVIAREVVEEPAPRREHARERAPVEAAAVQLRDEAAHMADLQPRERRVAGELEQAARSRA